jgi:formate hydrogenlyase transcriptional activator
MSETANLLAIDSARDDRELAESDPAGDDVLAGRGEFEPRRAMAVAASLDGLWEWDLARGVLHYSDRCAELLGYGKDEIPHTIDFFWSALHPEDVAPAQSAVNQCLEHGTFTDVEYRLRTKQGEYRWFRARGQTQRDAMGRASTMAGTLQDISDRMRASVALKESESRFRALCEASLAGIYIIQNGRIKYANTALGQMLACEPDELDGISPLVCIHPGDRAIVEENMRRRQQGEVETTQYEARFVRKDGKVVHVEVLGSRIDYDGEPALIGTLVDISDRKRAEAAMQDRLRFERLLADLSAIFVNIPPERLDEMIDSSLKSLVEFLGNDRTTLVRLTPDKRHVLATHSYAVPDCEPFPSGPVADHQLPWYIGRMRCGRTVFARCIPEDLPPEADKERRYCEAHGIKSNVAVPLKAGGSVLGAITFAFLKRRCEWSTEILPRLQLIGEVFANAIQHKRADEALRAAVAENEKLRCRLEQENQYLREQAVLKHHHGRIVGQSDALKRVLAEAERVAVTDTPVLLLGETGTGKELLAQTIHELSRRKDRPMVIVNCASLPATLIESELFGREAGAYTGAASAQVGRFVIADGSTLFLDEIGEFPVELQAKLLRVLQDGRFERLGSPETVTADVRIIAATNRNLEQAVREGKFRADLYHRLNVFPIRVPPLRERRDDVPLLVWAFVDSIGCRMGKTIKNVPRRTMEQLQRYCWPGNVRELSNVIERAMILASDDVLRVELPVAAEIAAAAPMSLKESERAQILRALDETGWRIRGEGGAAEILGIKPTTLEARMAKLGIQRKGRISKISWESPK